MNRDKHYLNDDDSSCFSSAYERIDDFEVLEVESDYSDLEDEDDMLLDFDEDELDLR